MSLRNLESALSSHVKERERKNRLGLVPLDIYDVLEETLPHGLVVQLGELILKCKGVG